jgi:hypothetical protein
MAKKIILSVLILIVLAVAGYLLKERFVDKAAQKAVIEERDTLQQKAGELEEKVVNLEKKLEENEQVVDENKIADAFSDVTGSKAQEGAGPENIGEKITNFFMYLDQKGYLTENGIQDNSSDFFMMIIDKLKHNRPVISGETENLYTLIKNITFFYRILGKENIKALKAIMDGQTEIIEPTMDIFYKWINPWNKIEEPGRLIVPADCMYEYASFFLKTISGQTYLFRRDSKIRNLTQYYCILILDRANDDNLNKYGIDIRPHIDMLMDDIKSHKQLVNRQEYLKNLEFIKQKY